MVALLVVDPWLARSYGFALSVLATLGLLLFAARWTQSWSSRLPGPVAAALAVPLAAQVTCTPVIVLLSGQISWVALPANLLAEPLVAPATVLGVGAALASVVSGTLAGLLAQLAAVPCRAIAAIARGLARVPGGQLPWPSSARGVLTLAVVTAVLVLAGPRLARRLAGAGGDGGRGCWARRLAGRRGGRRRARRRRGRVAGSRSRSDPPGRRRAGCWWPVTSGRATRSCWPPVRAGRSWWTPAPPRTPSTPVCAGSASASSTRSC